jgi:predicted nucleic acid-binding protein
MDTGPAILDTDTLSELGRGNHQVRERAVAYLKSFGCLTTTAVTVFERLRGYRLAIRQGKPFEPHLKAFELLVSTCVVLPFDGEAAGVAARIWSSVGQSGRRELGDVLIAAIAISRRLPLITRNRKDFEHLSRESGMELSLLDWTRAARRPSSLS